MEYAHHDVAVRILDREVYLRIELLVSVVGVEHRVVSAAVDDRRGDGDLHRARACVDPCGAYESAGLAFVVLVDLYPATVRDGDRGDIYDVPWILVGHDDVIHAGLIRGRGARCHAGSIRRGRSLLAEYEDADHDE